MLSHYAAGALRRLVPWDGRPIDVTVEGTARRARPQIRIHRTRNPERTRHRNVPVTPPARTLEDCAPVLEFVALRRAVREAFNRKLATTPELARARSSELRRIVADVQPTRSVLEDLVLDLIREAGFEDPEVNAPLERGGPLYPDFRWPHRRLIIEADGGGTHDNDLARHHDAVREARLAGDAIVRVTWREAVTQPAATVARLRYVKSASDSSIAVPCGVRASARAQAAA